jgi:hypothetical protein
MTEIIKEFPGHKFSHLATTTDVKTANDLLAEGWELKSATSFPAANQLGGMGVVAFFVFVKPK